MIAYIAQIGCGIIAMTVRDPRAQAAIALPESEAKQFGDSWAAVLEANPGFAKNKMVKGVLAQAPLLGAIVITATIFGPRIQLAASAQKVAHVQQPPRPPHQQPGTPGRGPVIGAPQQPPGPSPARPAVPPRGAQAPVNPPSANESVIGSSLRFEADGETFDLSDITPDSEAM